MDKFKLLEHIKELYANGGNIIEYLKSIDNSKINSLEDILISYDFQAGTYVKLANEKTEIRTKYFESIAKVINNLGTHNSILEVGVGEATTLGSILGQLSYSPNHIYGFDISWSRIKYGYSFLKSLGINNATLTTGDLFASPFMTNSIDIVYTSHSLEPNGGREKEALEELYRITNKYLVLLEPAYEYATDEGKARMEKHGYVKNLYSIAKELNYNVIEHRLFDVSVNPLNPTELIIIKKNETDYIGESHLACPISLSKLDRYDNVLFSEKSLLAYPIVDNIPCLLHQNAIIATHFLDKL